MSLINDMNDVIEKFWEWKQYPLSLKFLENELYIDDEGSMASWCKFLEKKGIIIPKGADRYMWNPVSPSLNLRSLYDDAVKFGLDLPEEK